MKRVEKDLIVVKAEMGTLVDASEEPKPTVYFDGSCPLCTAEMRHYASRPGGNDLNFVDVSRADAELGADLSAKDAMTRFHVRLPDGQLLSGARAFVGIWQTLRNWRWAGRIARVPGVIPLLEVAYRMFLPIRPALSRAASFLGARAANAPAEKR